MASGSKVAGRSWARSDSLNVGITRWKMSVCPCDGFDVLPRQLRAFPKVREALLRSLPSKPALEKWRARGQRPLHVEN